MTAISQSDPRLVYMKQDEVTSSTGFCFVMKDKWFAVNPDTGDLIFWQDEKKRMGKLIGASPQCNSSKETLEKLCQHRYPWAEVLFFERVSQPIDVRDYV